MGGVTPKFLEPLSSNSFWVAPVFRGQRFNRLKGTASKGGSSTGLEAATNARMVVRIASGKVSQDSTTSWRSVGEGLPNGTVDGTAGFPAVPKSLSPIGFVETRYRFPKPGVASSNLAGCTTNVLPQTPRPSGWRRSSFPTLTTSAKKRQFPQRVTLPSVLASALVIARRDAG